MTDGKNPLDLSGRSIVLTGGGGILGTRLTAALAALGGRVAVVDRDGAKAEQSAAQAPGATPYDADITSPDAVHQLRDQIRKDQGEPDVLINAVAWKSEHFFEPFESFPLSDWNEVMAVNTTGVFLTCQAFGADMAARGRGSIVNFLSIYGIVAPDPRIYEGSEYEGKAINTPAVYSTSKAAVWGLTRYLAAYWGPRGVRVNAVTPGGVSSGQNETFVKKYSHRVPLGRMARKDEISGAVLFLASDASSYITGQNVIVDGGLTAW